VQKVKFDSEGGDGEMEQVQKVTFDSEGEGRVEQNLSPSRSMRRLDSLRRLDPINRCHGDDEEVRRVKLEHEQEESQYDPLANLDLTDRSRSLSRLESVKDRITEQTLHEGPNLASSEFVQQRIHQLNSLVNKILGERGEVRTHPHLPENDDSEGKPEVKEVHLSAVRLSKFRELVLHILRPEHLPDIDQDDHDTRAREIEHSTACYTGLREGRGGKAGEILPVLPERPEMIQATSLVHRAVKNHVPDPRPDHTHPPKEASENPEDEAINKIFTEKKAQIRTELHMFELMVRKTTQTEHLSRLNPIDHV